MVTAYEAIPADERGNDPVPPFDSKFVLKKPFDLAQMFAKFNEIPNDGRYGIEKLKHAPAKQ